MTGLTMERRSLTFRVVGTPIPKGSLRPFLPKGSMQPIVRNDNPKTKGWQQLVREQAQHVAQHTLFVGPVVVAIVFRLPRPKFLPKHTLHHVTKPDVDKLARCVLDAMTNVIYADDKAVVELRVRKCYAPTGSAPSACISVIDAAPPQPAQSSLMFALEATPDNA
jgi:crossover junction endodeoxyribonuclease RusA